MPWGGAAPSLADIIAGLGGGVPGSKTHPTAASDVLSYPLRYGVSPEVYAQKEAELRKNLPPQLLELAGSKQMGGGQGEPNEAIIDRYLGQRIAAENSYWPSAALQGANQFAFGDYSLDPGEAERTKAAGDLGRNQGYGEEVGSSGPSLWDLLGG